MYAITGITGQVGGVVGRSLLVSGAEVRAVVRDAAKGAIWAAQGCQVAIADMTDADALASAFRDADGVFLLVPPMFDPAPGFPEVRAVITAIKSALAATRPAKVVCLSTIGAQAGRPSLLDQLGLMERELAVIDLPITFLRAAWFMENAANDVALARSAGTIASFLQPLNKAMPMVATGDVGQVAANLLRESWEGHRIVNLAGPVLVSPLDVAKAFTAALRRPVTAHVVPRETWEAVFTGQGAKHPEARALMLDGFNDGWLTFDAEGGDPICGTICIDTVIAELVERTASSPPLAGEPSIKSARS